jgi:MFS transporter, NNP family, nitrate/nitrite transporter
MVKLAYCAECSWRIVDFGKRELWSIRSGRGFSGESPVSSAFGTLFRTPTFWLMVILFGLGVSSTIGVYAMLPLYLVAERHMEPSWTNTIVAFSRSPGPIFGLLGGWASDKLGAKQTIVVSLGFTGLATLLVGLTSDTWLSLVVLLQPLLAVWFFQQRSRQSP